MKVATVNAARVPSTQTNFPAYVDLSRLGITTLAQAQSVRVYADAGMVTEWAREIVSATEMHVRVPSLTSTTSIYIDWDGVRADYAAAATFGRNAVWSDYAAVYHFQTDGTDSRGNNTLTGANSPGFVAGRLNGNATDLNGSNQYWSIADASQAGLDLSDAFTLQLWANPDALVNTDQMMTKDDVGVSRAYALYHHTGGIMRINIFGAGGNGQRTFDSPSSTVATGAWQLFHFKYNGVSANSGQWYKNGATVTTSVGDTGVTAITNSSAPFAVGIRLVFGVASNYFDGKIDEMRVRASGLSDNWIATEHNNQSNESDFWGSWTDVITVNRAAVMAFF